MAGERLSRSTRPVTDLTRQCPAVRTPASEFRTNASDCVEINDGGNRRSRQRPTEPKNPAEISFRETLIKVYLPAVTTATRSSQILQRKASLLGIDEQRADALSTASIFGLQRVHNSARILRTSEWMDRRWPKSSQRSRVSSEFTDEATRLSSQSTADAPTDPDPPLQMLIVAPPTRQTDAGDIHGDSSAPTPELGLIPQEVLNDKTMLRIVSEPLILENELAEIWRGFKSVEDTIELAPRAAIQAMTDCLVELS